MYYDIDYLEIRQVDCTLTGFEWRAYAESRYPEGVLVGAIAGISQLASRVMTY
jgi:hypothetical protein